MCVAPFQTNWEQRGSVDGIARQVALRLLLPFKVKGSPRSSALKVRSEIEGDAHWAVIASHDFRVDFRTRYVRSKRT